MKHQYSALISAHSHVAFMVNEHGRPIVLLENRKEHTAPPRLRARATGAWHADCMTWLCM
jgi:hypothetical protein